MRLTLKSYGYLSADQRFEIHTLCKAYTSKVTGYKMIDRRTGTVSYFRTLAAVRATLKIV